MSNKELQQLRGEIDKLDNQLAELLERRFEIVMAIGGFKKDNDMPVEDLVREEEILSRYESALLKEIFKVIFRHSKNALYSK